MLEPRKGKKEFLTHAACCASRYGNIIGLQNGRFPPMGDHVPNEMGGVWLHPVKVLDGFYLQINGETVDFTEYEIAPWGQYFASEKGKVSIRREDVMTNTHKGAVITYSLSETGDQQAELDVTFVARFHLMPVWFAEAKGFADAPDCAEVLEDQTLLAHDAIQPWYAAVSGPEGFTGKVIGRASPDNHQNRGVTATLNGHIVLSHAGSVKLRFVIAGSHHSREEALMELQAIRLHAERLIAERKEHACQIQETAKITTDNEQLNTVLGWIKQNTDWLVQTVEEIGTGLTAGLPEYPWWFGCDSTYALQGCLAAGMVDLCKKTLLLLNRISGEHNGNGRIVHEINTFGAVYNPGNVQETAHFITMVRKFWDWTGDREFLQEVYDGCCMGIGWLLSQVGADCPIPQGYGIVEINGLDVCLIDAAAYTCQALFDMYALSAAMGEKNEGYLELGEQLKAYINEQCWVESEKQYCDCVATPAEVLSCIPLLHEHAAMHSNAKENYHAYLERLEVSLKGISDNKKKRPFLLAKNWVILTPIEAGIADPDKAKRALEASFNDEYIGPWGVYLSASMKDHTMTISTGLRTVSEIRAGRIDEAYSLLDKLMSNFEQNMPGSLSEMSPDYGCFVQAWTIYSAMVPVVNGFAGIQADAASKTIQITPHLPSQLHYLKIEKLPIGDGYITVEITRKGVELETVIHSDLKKWKVRG